MRTLSTLAFRAARLARRPGLLLAVLLGTLLLVPAALAAKQLYTCGMHPQIIRDAPGDCPICGMKLQPILSSSAAPAAAGERKIKYYQSSMNPGEVSDRPGKDSMGMELVPVYADAAPAGTAVRIDAGTVQRMNLRTGLVTRGPLRRAIRTVGAVAYNEEGFRDITLKYEGWIERLAVNATWTSVKAGDALFSVYSPELYAAELNFVAARQADGDAAGPLARAAEQRLRLLDLAPAEIEQLAQTGEVPRTRVLTAPADGVVVEKMAVAGQMMKPGEKIYRLADLSTVWVVAQIYESDLLFVHEGQAVTVRTTYGAARDYTGTIARLLPQVDEQTRAVAARIVVPNPDGFLRPGMFADVHFAAQLADSALLVPEMAVLRSGERNTVFVALDGGRFEPRTVQLGVRGENGAYEVLAGLAEGERIVTSGQFLLDSESQLQEAIQKMLTGDSAAPAPSAAAHPAPTSGHEKTDAAADHAAEVAAPATLYTCPMEEHADVVADHPGDCPQCGMALVPTATVAHGPHAEAVWRQQHAATGSAPAGAAPAHHHGD